jgi:perosamine synthetase
MVHGGDGGFVVAKDPRLAARLANLVNHGFTPAFHFVHHEPAINAKMQGLAAALACGCLDQLDFIMEHRAGLAAAYRKALRGHLPPGAMLMPPCGPLDTPWVFGLTCASKRQRTELRAFLAARGIETRDFFFPLHLQPAYSHLGREKALPFAEELGSTGLYLPTHTNLRPEDVEYICASVVAFFVGEDTDESNAVMFPLVKLNKTMGSINRLVN